MRKHKTLLFCLLCILFISTMQLAEASALTIDKMILDYEVMWEFIKTEIPFVVSAIKDKGKDINAIIAHYKSMIQDNVSTVEFADIIAECVAEAEGAGHFVVCSTAEIRSLQNTRSTVIKELVDIDKILLFYNELGNNWEVNRFYDYEYVDYDKYQFTQMDDTIKVHFFDDDKTAYISFDMFVKTNGIGKVYSFYKKLKDYTNLIIDLRKNTGGLSSFWKEEIVARIATKDYDYECYASYSLGEHTIKFYNMGADPRKYSQINEGDALFTLPGFLATIKNMPEYEKLIIRSKSKIKKDNVLSVNYRGQIWVLVNNNTQSAADEFVNFCKSTGFAKIVGTPTGGNGVSAAPSPLCLFMLPNSGLLIRYYPYMGFNMDGSSNINKGDAPDIFTTEDALEKCLLEIRSKK